MTQSRGSGRGGVVAAERSGTWGPAEFVGAHHVSRRVFRDGAAGARGTRHLVRYSLPRAFC